MTTVIIDKKIGLSLESLPDSLLRTIKSELIDGQMGISYVFDITQKTRIFNILSDISASPLEMVHSPIGEDTYLIRIRENATQVTAHPQGERIVGLGDEEEDDGEEEYEGEEENGDCEPYIKEPSVIIETEGRVDPEKNFEVISAALENDVTNQAAMLSEKKRAFEKLWAKMVQEKREIDEATALVKGNPVVKSLLDQIEELDKMDNMIQEIFLTTSKIVIITKPIITSYRVGDQLRIIGRMHISINLKSFIGNPSKDTCPIVIRNLDRRVYFDGENWECAHVPSDGIPCWGTAWEPIFTAFVKRDIHLLSDILIRFISSPNLADSWGGCAHHFPEFSGLKTVSENTTRTDDEEDKTSPRPAQNKI